MAKIKLCKKLRVLLISLISIISMSITQVNAIHYVDGRFVINEKLIDAIVKKANENSSSHMFAGKVQTNENRISFTIVSPDGLNVNDIVLTIPLSNTTKSVYMSMTPKGSITILDVLSLLCYPNSTPGPIDYLFSYIFLFANKPPSISSIQLASPDFYTSLKNVTNVSQFELLNNSNPNVKAYEIVAEEFVVFNIVDAL